MTEYQRRDWTEALAILAKALAKIDEALLLYSADADDRDFRFFNQQNRPAAQRDCRNQADA